MGKVKISKNDYLRVILTETLPYEVPITFSNEGFYLHLTNSSELKDKSVNFINKFFEYKDYTQPYNYRINKNSDSKRLLSVPHPAIQIQISNLYEKYDSLLSELCKRSPVSLRAPSKVASRYYEKELVKYEAPAKAMSVEVENRGFDSNSVYASSYFTYKKYNFLYKFYDSYESHRIEKKFEHLTRFDISKCFHNIYIPTLSWAIKNKAFSKKYSNNFSFEGLFQKIMINANDLDSSGIIVGPEFSRIFAEIILQDIDRNIIKRLKEENNLVFDSDYTLRRYVDDYFLYTKNKSIPMAIFPLIKDELEKYKLFINESKTEYHEVPFITGLTIAKMDCKELVSNTYDEFIRDDPSSFDDEKFLFFSGFPGSKSNSFIKNIKRIVKVNDVNYESLTGYTLSEIRRHLNKLIQDERIIEAVRKGNSMSIQKLILMTIEISFFIYNMDIRVRTTYIITQMIVFLNKLAAIGSIEFQDEISKKLYDESVLLISKMKDKGKANSIETLNLLIGISTNIRRYPINESKLLNLFNLQKNQDDLIELVQGKSDLGYFQIMVLSYFIQKGNSGVTTFLESFIKNKLLMSGNVFSDSELVLMFFDSVSNPNFSDIFKEDIILQLYNSAMGVNPTLNELAEIKKYISSKEWFFTWQSTNLEQVLMKKELRSPY